MSDEVVVVAVDGSDDPVTEILCRYRNEHVYPYLRDRGFMVTCVQGAKARRDHVGSLLDDQFDYLTGSGHGTPSAFCGWKGEALLGSEGNPDDPLDFPPGRRIVHLLACDTADTLGQRIVGSDDGQVAFFGYDEPITSPGEPSAREMRPMLECDSEIDRLLADGYSAREVLKLVKTKFDYEIRKLKRDDRIAGAAHLKSMKKSLKLTGNPRARLWRRHRIGATFEPALIVIGGGDGLERDDVITEINGAPIGLTPLAELRRRLRQDDELEFTVVRRGRRIRAVSVKPEAAPEARADGAVGRRAVSHGNPAPHERRG